MMCGLQTLWLPKVGQTSTNPQLFLKPLEPALGRAVWTKWYILEKLIGIDYWRRQEGYDYQ